MLFIDKKSWDIWTLASMLRQNKAKRRRLEQKLKALQAEGRVIYELLQSVD